jgi:hypothetical protein
MLQNKASPLIPMPLSEDLMTVVAYSDTARGHCEMMYHAKAM